MQAPAVRRFDLVAIAAAVVAIAVIAWPSCHGPDVAIRGPARDVVIDRRGDVALAVVVHGTVGRLAIELDGVVARAPAVLDPPLPPGGDCDDGCPTTVRWNDDDAPAGAHDLAVVAYDERGRRGAAHVAIDVRDQVRAEWKRPASLDLRGAQATTIVVGAIFRGGVRGELTVDGGDPRVTRAGDCRAGCELAWPLELTGLAGGAHRIAWTVIDDEGHRATGADTLVVGDEPWISAIRVTGETDGPGTRLEVEVHLEDATTGLDLGCSGDKQGLGPVDFDDTDYAVHAWFVRPDGRPLAMDDLAGRRVRVHVIEDDALPCPGPITKKDDDMGRSEAVDPAALPTVRGGFGEVVGLRLEIGRPR